VGREVPTVIIRLPVNDVRVIALRKPSKSEKVTAEPRESERNVVGVVGRGARAFS
jgi:hypothetical protein